jgi:SAM-dependent methyltransferase
MKLKVKISGIYNRCMKTHPGNLDPKQWHDVIIDGSTPAILAEKIHTGNYPGWLLPILGATRSGDLTLELGSGSGELSAHLACQGRQVTLLDFSQDQLLFANKLFELSHIHGKFIHGDVLNKLPFQDKSFDCVWSSGLLEHFEDKEIEYILSESVRVSKNIVLALVPNAASIAYRIGKWYQEKENAWKWGMERPMFSLKGMFETVGLRDITESTIAPEHALEFLTMPGSDPVKQVFRDWLKALDEKEIDRIRQGYLLVTMGTVPNV